MYLYRYVSMFNHGFCRHYCTHAARRNHGFCHHHYTHVVHLQGPEPFKARQFVFRGIARAHTYNTHMYISFRVIIRFRCNARALT